MYHLLIRLARASDKLPHSLFVTGVICDSRSPVCTGGFADVYVGQYKGKKVALKRLRFFSLSTKEEQESLERAFVKEVLVWRPLRHKNIVPLEGIDRTTFKSVGCMILPWMEGGSVTDFVKGLSNPSAHRLNTLIHDIVCGLEHLHSVRLVHGDLRTPNVLVDERGTARLSDFGLAISPELGSLGFSSVRAGQSYWLAPELLEPKRFGLSSDRPTYAGDVFALGFICWEIYTQRRSFPEFTGVGRDRILTRLILRGTRPDRPVTPAGVEMEDRLWTLVQQCWAQEAEHRPRTEMITKEVEHIVSLSGTTVPFKD